MATLNAGTSTISITEGQLKALGFPSLKPTKIGCGKDACAYLGKNADAVVKITKSESDALACYLLSKAGAIPRWSAPVHAVYRLPKNTFAIAMAKVDPLNTKWSEPIDELYEYADEEDLEPDEWDVFREDCLKEIEWRAAERGHPAESDRNIRQALELVNEAVSGLREMGFDWFDYHSDNWGIYKEHPVLIDFGRLESRDGSSIEKRVREIPVLPF